MKRAHSVAPRGASSPGPAAPRTYATICVRGSLRNISALLSMGWSKRHPAAKQCGRYCGLGKEPGQRCGLRSSCAPRNYPPICLPALTSVPSFRLSKRRRAPCPAPARPSDAALCAHAQSGSCVLANKAHRRRFTEDHQGSFQQCAEMSSIACPQRPDPASMLPHGAGIFPRPMSHRLRKIIPTRGKTPQVRSKSGGSKSYRYLAT